MRGCDATRHDGLDPEIRHTRFIIINNFVVSDEFSFSLTMNLLQAFN